MMGRQEKRGRAYRNFDDIPSGSYTFLMADPPWRFKLRSEKGWKKSAQGKYKCMSLDDIKGLPVRRLAAPNANLLLWATFPMHPVAFEVLAAWGFEYKTGGVWHKRTRHGKTAFGTGYRVRCAAEPWLLGTIGNPPYSRSHRNLFEGLTREHSRKPEEGFAWAESYDPDARRIELFSREPRDGWDTWGDEVEKFGPAPAVGPAVTTGLSA